MTRAVCTKLTSQGVCSCSNCLTFCCHYRYYTVQQSRFTHRTLTAPHTHMKRNVQCLCKSHDHQGEETNKPSCTAMLSCRRCKRTFVKTTEVNGLVAKVTSADNKNLVQRNNGGYFIKLGLEISVWAPDSTSRSVWSSKCILRLLCVCVSGAKYWLRRERTMVSWGQPNANDER